MNEFKIGDKVVVLTDATDSLYMHGFTKGDVGVVTQIDTDGDFFVSVDVKGTQILHPSELELVNE